MLPDRLLLVPKYHLTNTEIKQIPNYVSQKWRLTRQFTGIHDNVSEELPAMILI
jgi:hypothetical protein